MVVNISSQGIASSDVVVGTSLASAINRKNLFLPDPVIAGRRVVSLSVIDKDIDLNRPVKIVGIFGVVETVKTGNEEKSREKILQSRPTADFVRRTGFKVDSKMIIKVDASESNGVDSRYIPNLIFDKFSLQTVTESDDERYQLHETFSDEVLFVFGRRPRVWTLVGIVANTPGADFTTQLLQDYNDFYRGTRVVDLGARTFVFYEDVIIEGTLLSLSATRNSQIPSAVNVAMTIVVHERAFVGQEEREGITDANVANLLARSKVLLRPNVQPDDVRAPKKTASQARNEAALAAERESSSQQSLADIENEIDAAFQAATQSDEDVTAAEDDVDAAKSALAAAVLAGDEEAIAEIRRDLAGAEARVADARSRLADAETALSSAKKRREEIVTAAADSASGGDVSRATADASSRPQGFLVEGLRQGGVTVVAALFESQQDPGNDEWECVVQVVTANTSDPSKDEDPVHEKALTSDGEGDAVLFGSLDSVLKEFNEVYNLTIPTRRTGTYSFNVSGYVPV